MASSLLIMTPLLQLVERVQHLNNARHSPSTRRTDTLTTRPTEETMQGWLDVLETHGGGLVGARKAWTRRFLTLNAVFQSLEVFKDASQQERVARIDLGGGGASVATADELGEALLGDRSRGHFLASNSVKLSIENSRRFVFRVTEAGGDSNKPRQHYLCAEVYDDVASNRECLDQWLRALRRVIDASSPRRQSSGAAKMDTRDLSAQIAAFAERLHLSATVVARHKPTGSSAQYQLLVKAWVLARELVSDDDSVDGHATARQSWQVLEYSCEWRVGRSTAQLRDFDARLRQFAGRELRDVTFPSVSTPASHVVPCLLHAGDGASMDADSQRRVALYDAYMQGVLRLPALSTVGSDAGAVLDTFLEVPSHLTALRKVERETGTSLHLSQRRVVPWEHRVHFEELHAMYMEQLQAREEQLMQQQQRQQQQQQQQQQVAHKRANDQEKAKREREPRERRHHSRSHHDRDSVDDHQERASMRATAPVAPLPAPTSPPSDPVKVRPCLTPMLFAMQTCS